MAATTAIPKVARSTAARQQQPSPAAVSEVPAAVDAVPSANDEDLDDNFPSFMLRMGQYEGSSLTGAHSPASRPGGIAEPTVASHYALTTLHGLGAQRRAVHRSVASATLPSHDPPLRLRGGEDLLTALSNDNAEELLIQYQSQGLKTNVRTAMEHLVHSESDSEDGAGSEEDGKGDSPHEDAPNPTAGGPPKRRRKTRAHHESPSVPAGGSKTSSPQPSMSPGSRSGSASILNSSLRQELRRQRPEIQAHSNALTDNTAFNTALRDVVMKTTLDKMLQCEAFAMDEIAYRPGGSVVRSGLHATSMGLVLPLTWYRATLLKSCQALDGVVGRLKTLREEEKNLRGMKDRPLGVHPGAVGALFGAGGPSASSVAGTGVKNTQATTYTNQSSLWPDKHPLRLVAQSAQFNTLLSSGCVEVATALKVGLLWRMLEQVKASTPGMSVAVEMFVDLLDILYVGFQQEHLTWSPVANLASKVEQLLSLPLSLTSLQEQQQETEILSQQCSYLRLSMQNWAFQIWYGQLLARRRRGRFLEKFEKLLKKIRAKTLLRDVFGAWKHAANTLRLGSCMAAAQYSLEQMVKDTNKKVLKEQQQLKLLSNAEAEADRLLQRQLEEQQQQHGGMIETAKQRRTRLLGMGGGGGGHDDNGGAPGGGYVMDLGLDDGFGEPDPPLSPAERQSQHAKEHRSKKRVSQHVALANKAEQFLHDYQIKRASDEKKSVKAARLEDRKRRRANGEMVPFNDDDDEDVDDDSNVPVTEPGSPVSPTSPMSPRSASRQAVALATTKGSKRNEPAEIPPLTVAQINSFKTTLSKAIGDAAFVAKVCRSQISSQRDRIEELQSVRSTGHQKVIDLEQKVVSLVEESLNQRTEIDRLKNILAEKDREIARLQSKLALQEHAPWREIAWEMSRFVADVGFPLSLITHGASGGFPQPSTQYTSGGMSALRSGASTVDAPPIPAAGGIASFSAALSPVNWKLSVAVATPPASTTNSIHHGGTNSTNGPLAVAMKIGRKSVSGRDGGATAVGSSTRLSTLVVGPNNANVGTTPLKPTPMDGPTLIMDWVNECMDDLQRLEAEMLTKTAYRTIPALSPVTANNPTTSLSVNTAAANGGQGNGLGMSPWGAFVAAPDGATWKDVMSRKLISPVVDTATKEADGVLLSRLLLYLALPRFVAPGSSPPVTMPTFSATNNPQAHHTATSRTTAGGTAHQNANVGGKFSMNGPTAPGGNNNINAAAAAGGPLPPWVFTPTYCRSLLTNRAASLSPLFPSYWWAFGDFATMTFIERAHINAAMAAQLLELDLMYKGGRNDDGTSGEYPASAAAGGPSAGPTVGFALGGGGGAPSLTGTSSTNPVNSNSSKLCVSPTALSEGDPVEFLKLLGLLYLKFAHPFQHGATSPASAAHQGGDHRGSGSLSLSGPASKLHQTLSNLRQMSSVVATLQQQQQQSGSTTTTTINTVTPVLGATTGNFAVPTPVTAPIKLDVMSAMAALSYLSPPLESPAAKQTVLDGRFWPSAFFSTPEQLATFAGYMLEARFSLERCKALVLWEVVLVGSILSVSPASGVPLPQVVVVPGGDAASPPASRDGLGGGGGSSTTPSTAAVVPATANNIAAMLGNPKGIALKYTSDRFSQLITDMNQRVLPIHADGTLYEKDIDAVIRIFRQNREYLLQLFTLWAGKVVSESALEYVHVGADALGDGSGGGGGLPESFYTSGISFKAWLRLIQVASISPRHLSLDAGPSMAFALSNPALWQRYCAKLETYNQQERDVVEMLNKEEKVVSYEDVIAPGGTAGGGGGGGDPFGSVTSNRPVPPSTANLSVAKPTVRRRSLTTAVTIKGGKKGENAVKEVAVAGTPDAASSSTNAGGTSSSTAGPATTLSSHDVDELVGQHRLHFPEFVEALLHLAILVRRKGKKELPATTAATNRPVQVMGRLQQPATLSSMHQPSPSLSAFDEPLRGGITPGTASPTASTAPLMVGTSTTGASSSAAGHRKYQSGAGGFDSWSLAAGVSTTGTVAPFPLNGIPTQQYPSLSETLDWVLKRVFGPATRNDVDGFWQMLELHPVQQVLRIRAKELQPLFASYATPSAHQQQPPSSAQLNAFAQNSAMTLAMINGDNYHGNINHKGPLGLSLAGFTRLVRDAQLLTTEFNVQTVSDIFTAALTAVESGVTLAGPTASGNSASSVSGAVAPSSMAGASSPKSGAGLPASVISAAAAANTASASNTTTTAAGFNPPDPVMRYAAFCRSLCLMTVYRFPNPTISFAVRLERFIVRCIVEPLRTKVTGVARAKDQLVAAAGAASTQNASNGGGGGANASSVSGAFSKSGVNATSAGFDATAGRSKNATSASSVLSPRPPSSGR